MSENKTYPVFENIARKSHIQKKNYEQMYLRSIEEPESQMELPAVVRRGLQIF